jgi:hypothetical protein
LHVNIVCIGNKKIINKVITLKTLIRLVATAIGVALAVASFDLEVIVLAWVL